MEYDVQKVRQTVGKHVSWVLSQSRLGATGSKTFLKDDFTWTASKTMTGMSSANCGQGFKNYEYGCVLTMHSTQPIPMKVANSWQG